MVSNATIGFGIAVVDQSNRYWLILVPAGKIALIFPVGDVHKDESILKLTGRLGFTVTMTVSEALQGGLEVLMTYLQVPTLGLIVMSFVFTFAGSPAPAPAGILDHSMNVGPPLSVEVRLTIGFGPVPIQITLPPEALTEKFVSILTTTFAVSKHCAVPIVAMNTLSFCVIVAIP